jgi:hypothetical protein
MFCNIRRSRGREDVVSTWIANEIGGSSPFFADLWTFHADVLVHADTRKIGSVAGYKAPDVCQECNRGWMSRLEHRAKAILLPLIRGQQASIYRGQQRTVALWAVEHALTFDQWYGGVYGHSPFIPRELGTHLLYHDKNKPIPHSSVRLGSYISSDRGVEHPNARRTRFRFIRPGVPIGQIVEVSFVFGHLILQVTIYVGNSSYAAVDFITPSRNPYFIGCWPYQHDRVKLPVPIGLNRAGFERVVSGPWFAANLRSPIIV